MFCLQVQEQITVFCLQVTGLADLTGSTDRLVGLVQQEDCTWVVSFGEGSWSVFNR